MALIYKSNYFYHNEIKNLLSKYCQAIEYLAFRKQIHKSFLYFKYREKVALFVHIYTYTSKN